MFALSDDRVSPSEIKPSLFPAGNLNFTTNKHNILHGKNRATPLPFPPCYSLSLVIQHSIPSVLWCWLVVWNPLILDPSDGTFGRFNLAAVATPLMFVYVVCSVLPSPPSIHPSLPSSLLYCSPAAVLMTQHPVTPLAVHGHLGV